jgi:hypothetical protein
MKVDRQTFHVETDKHACICLLCYYWTDRYSERDRQ